MRWFTFSCIAALFAVICASVAAEPGASTPVSPAQTLGQLPNVTVTYYDVSGTDIGSINRSVGEQRRLAAKNSTVAATDWNLVVRLDKRTTGGQCSIAGSSIEFSAKALLPRLVNEEAVSPAVQASWRKYVAVLESESVAKLWFVFDRIGGIEQAFEGKSCEQGKLDGGRAIAQLEQDYAAFVSKAETSPLALNSRGSTEDDEVTCKTLNGKGGGKGSKPVCMSNRDWATLEMFGK
jgi:predicted secreted Zn-dependent protease